MTFFLNPTIPEKKNNPSFILAQKQMSTGDDKAVVRRQKTKGSLGRRWHIPKEMAFNETNARGSWLVFLAISCPHIPWPMFIFRMLMSSEPGARSRFALWNVSGLSGPCQEPQFTSCFWTQWISYCICFSRITPNLTNHEFSYEVLTKERAFEQFSLAVCEVMINPL